MTPFGTIPSEKESGAERAMMLYGAARVAHSDAIDRLTALQRQRPQQKTAALVRLCATAHPVTGKNYSVSQAEDVLQLDAEYQAYKELVAEAEQDVRTAEGDERAAYLVALLRVNEVGGHWLTLPAYERTDVAR
ncbi:MAG TPA: hypothetical protein VGP44_03715 [Gemmatimonadales bacterium]|nr:hypothetical protein [Gemmatimonadales bacterium]